MKFCFYTIITSLLLFSCKPKPEQESERTKRWEVRLEQHMNNAKASEMKIDSIFLDFRFGMSEDEVKNHYKELETKGKIYTDKGYYTYDFHTNISTVKSHINTEFYNNKLYRLTLNFESLDESGDDSKLIMYVVGKVFDDKASKEGLSKFLFDDEYGDRSIHYTKDNLAVEISSSYGAKMSYTNAPILKQIEADEEEKRNMTKSDL